MKTASNMGIRFRRSICGLSRCTRRLITKPYADSFTRLISFLVPSKSTNLNENSSHPQDFHYGGPISRKVSIPPIKNKIPPHKIPKLGWMVNVEDTQKKRPALGLFLIQIAGIVFPKSSIFAISAHFHLFIFVPNSAKYFFSTIGRKENFFEKNQLC